MQTFCLTFFGMKLCSVTITETNTRGKAAAIVCVKERKTWIIWFNIVAMHKIKLVYTRV